MLENQTGEYYFKQMKCSQKIKFKRNLLNKYPFPKVFFREKYSSFENMVCAAFVWDETKQGYVYWYNVSRMFSKTN